MGRPMRGPAWERIWPLGWILTLLSLARLPVIWAALICATDFGGMDPSNPIQALAAFPRGRGIDSPVGLPIPAWG